jgi:hypothetical protein
MALKVKTITKFEKVTGKSFFAIMKKFSQENQSMSDVVDILYLVRLQEEPTLEYGKFLPDDADLESVMANVQTAMETVSASMGG